VTRKYRIALLAAGLLLFGIPAAWIATSPGLSRSALYATPGTDVGTLRFPEHFYWGVAISGQQAESQQPSDWTTFERDVYRDRRFESGVELGTTKPGHIRGLGRWSDTVRLQKTGFEKSYPEDLETVGSMGLNAFRTSIEWARLFPRADMIDPAPEGIAYYKRLLAEMKKRGITPFITLSHYAVPEWFSEPDGAGRKGWERQDALKHWQRFVSAVADNFIPDVEQWCTLNEPMVYVYEGYIEGIYPPREKRPDFAAAADVLDTLLRAHLIAYNTLHKVADGRHAGVNVGIAQNVGAFEPLRNWAPLDRLIAGMAEQAWNWDFLDAIESGRLKLAGTDIDRRIDGLKGAEDFIGINYYNRLYVKSDLFHPTAPTILEHDPAAAHEPYNDLGWDAYPHGFYQVLTQAYRRYGKPIYVLENGTADKAEDDVARQKFLVSHVREVWLAINRGGADVRSYIHWSLFDNFEWVEGFDARFGLMAVDYEHGFNRTARPSAKLYSTIAGTNALPASLILQYGRP
jgi:beta-glucosidase